MNFRTMLAMDKAPAYDGAATAAGIMLITPEGLTLFLKRAATSDHPGTWAWPGGGIEGNETAEEAAKRETSEEIGHQIEGEIDPIDHQANDQSAFTTFSSRVGEHFLPKLNSEHSAYAWAPLNDPPQPLHPGVEATLKKLQTTQAMDAEFEEGDHPRDNSGKFGSGGNSSSKSPFEGKKGNFKSKSDNLKDKGLSPKKKGNGKSVTESAQIAWHHAIQSGKQQIMIPSPGRGGWQFLKDDIPYGGPHLTVDPDGTVTIHQPDFNRGAKDAFAFDRATVRQIDANGSLHVASTNISKANVCPYLGREIPDWQALNLDPEKVYMLYRDPEELAKAAPSFDNLPLLSKHIETTADDHKKDFVIGSTGTGTVFEPPFLKSPLVIWDGPYIEAVEDESQKELSSAYRYRADMQPGEVELDGKSVKFDGTMRDIIGNHVALVKEGRAGSDVVVGDSTEELQMKNALSLKAVMARGAIAAFLAPKLAQDAKIPLSALLAGVTAKNFAAKKPLLLKGLHDAIKGKLAKDESAEGLKTLLDALETAPVVDEADPMADATFDKDDLDAGVNPKLDHNDDPAEGKDDPMQAVMEFLKGKLSPEDMAQIEAMCSAEAGQATDDPPPFNGMPKKPGATETPPAKDKEMVSKEDAEKLVKGASDAVRVEVLKTQREIRDAEKLVKPYVGEMAMACDSAASVLKTALGAMNVDGIDKIDDVNALTVILKSQPLPGARKEPAKNNHAFDAAGAKSFAERNPGVARIKNL